MTSYERRCLKCYFINVVFLLSEYNKIVSNVLCLPHIVPTLRTEQVGCVGLFCHKCEHNQMYIEGHITHTSRRTYRPDNIANAHIRSHEVSSYATISSPEYVKCPPKSCFFCICSDQTSRLSV